uniref:Uncharacterized protein n=1 Tax=Arundo donax TaxID=35708 RepID=A0A0A8Y199_ARUDO
MARLREPDKGIGGSCFINTETALKPMELFSSLAAGCLCFKAADCFIFLLFLYALTRIQ